MPWSHLRHSRTAGVPHSKQEHAAAHLRYTDGGRCRSRKVARRMLAGPAKHQSLLLTRLPVCRLCGARTLPIGGNQLLCVPQDVLARQEHCRRCGKACRWRSRPLSIHFPTSQDFFAGLFPLYCNNDSREPQQMGLKCSGASITDTEFGWLFPVCLSGVWSNIAAPCRETTAKAMPPS